jgi:hypothetical protein
MGLDMYLEIRREEYSSHHTKSRTLKREYPKFLKDNFPNLPELYSVSRKTYFEVGYWRKANAIHNWFVENCGDGEDTCQQMYVSLEKLETLLDICKKVSADHKLAPVYLPTQSGFFFGSTEYDDWYFDKIEDTIKIIEPVIEFLKNIKDKCKSNDWYDVVYQASW